MIRVNPRDPGIDVVESVGDLLDYGHKQQQGYIKVMIIYIYIGLYIYTYIYIYIGLYIYIDWLYFY